MDDLLRRAEAYVLEARLHLRQKLGFGQDGSVWVAESPDGAASAVKAFERETTYRRERDCYLRLAERDVRQIGPFVIPGLIAHHDDLFIVEVDIVTPPYLIDFGKAHLDRRPDFSEETMADWDADGEERFGERWEVVRSAVAALRMHGIYYLDVSANNVRFE